MKKLVVSVAVLFFVSPAFARIKTKMVDYEQAGVALQGYLAYDDSYTTKRPGVVVVHEWMGLNDYAKKRAVQLAEQGYVALAADIYGKGIVTTDIKEAGRLSSIYKSDRKLMRARAQAALEELLKNSLVNANHVAAMGYCFGGTVALELARSGAPLVGVVSFHGGLDTPNPSDAANIKGKVLVLHGGDDPYVPSKDVLAFEEEMRSAKVDWQLVAYGNAVHAFTNPKSGDDNSKGAAYNEKADKRSWDHMKLFFREIFR